MPDAEKDAPRTGGRLHCTYCGEWGHLNTPCPTYAPMPDAPDPAAAIATIEDSRRTHIEWRDWWLKNKAEGHTEDCCEEARQAARLAGGLAHQEACIGAYDNVLAVLRDNVEQVVTDCCGRLLPKWLVLVGDAHIPGMCPACQWLDGRAHESHITCDRPKGVECPGPDWTYSGDPSNPVATSVLPPGEGRA